VLPLVSLTGELTTYLAFELAEVGLKRRVISLNSVRAFEWQAIETLSLAGLN
jgi:hypothetical protein